MPKTNTRKNNNNNKKNTRCCGKAGNKNKLFTKNEIVELGMPRSQKLMRQVREKEYASSFSHANFILKCYAWFSAKNIIKGKIEDTWLFVLILVE